MFEKVLIAEDYESVSISVKKTLESFNIKNTEYVYYCDDARTRIQKELQADAPFDLLITDLSFEEDHREQQIAGGKELIKIVKQLQPDLKVLVFSIEKRKSIADSLFNELDIDAYVPKGRQDAKDLELAIEAIAKGKKYYSPKLKGQTQEEYFHDFTDLDKKIIFLLPIVERQKDIPAHLIDEKIKVSLSTIEKRINLMKTDLGLNNNAQLIAYCKDKYPHFFNKQ